MLTAEDHIFQVVKMFFSKTGKQEGEMYTLRLLLCDCTHDNTQPSQPFHSTLTQLCAGLCIIQIILTVLNNILYYLSSYCLKLHLLAMYEVD